MLVLLIMYLDLHLFLFLEKFFAYLCYFTSPLSTNKLTTLQCLLWASISPSIYPFSLHFTSRSLLTLQYEVYHYRWVGGIVVHPVSSIIEFGKKALVCTCMKLTVSGQTISVQAGAMSYTILMHTSAFLDANIAGEYEITSFHMRELSCSLYNICIELVLATFLQNFTYAFPSFYEGDKTIKTQFVILILWPKPWSSCSVHLTCITVQHLYQKNNDMSPNMLYIPIWQ